jgi:hypothetical protein
VNVTLTTQSAPAASIVPLHPSLPTVKSPAEGTTVSICSAVLFGLVRVTFLAEAVSTSCWGNESTTGTMVSLVRAACAGAAPNALRIKIATSASAVLARPRCEELGLSEVRFDEFAHSVMAHSS